MANNIQQFNIGDRVAVLRACRLPQVEEVIGEGTIVSMTEGSSPLYFIDCFPCGRDYRVLRLIEKGGA